MTNTGIPSKPSKTPKRTISHLKMNITQLKYKFNSYKTMKKVNLGSPS